MSFPDKPVAQLLGSNGPVHAVTYSAGAGSYILAGSADRSIRLYNPQPTLGAADRNNYITATAAAAGVSPSPPPLPIPEGRLIQTYGAVHGYEVLSLACAADNASFVSAGGDRTVFFWDVSTAQTLRRFGGPGGHTGRVHSVCFAGDGDSLVVSGSFDTTVRLWDIRAASSSRPLMTLAEARDAISAVAAHGPVVLAASVDGRVRSYDVRMGRQTTDVISGDAGVTSLCLTRDGRSMLVGALDSRLRLMDRENGTCLRMYGAVGGGGGQATGKPPSTKEKPAKQPWHNEELRVQSVLGGRERFVVAGDERPPPSPSSPSTPAGRVWAWDLLSGALVAQLAVPWGPPGTTNVSRAIGRDGREKERRNVTSCLAWRDGGWGDQFCVGGTSGVVTVFGGP